MEENSSQTLGTYSEALSWVAENLKKEASESNPQRKGILAIRLDEIRAQIDNVIKTLTASTEPFNAVFQRIENIKARLSRDPDSGLSLKAFAPK